MKIFKYLARRSIQLCLLQYLVNRFWPDQAANYQIWFQIGQGGLLVTYFLLLLLFLWVYPNNKVQKNTKSQS